MAYDAGYLTIPGFVATGDLSSSQYKLVKLASTAGAVKVCSAATDVSIGVLYNEPASGEAALVAHGGVVKMLSEASVTAGAYVAPSTTGRAKVTTTGNDDVVGIALTAGDAGDIISVLWARFNY